MLARNLEPAEQNENRGSNKAKHEDDELEAEICRFEHIVVGSLIVWIPVRQDAFRADVRPPERQVDCNVDKAQSDNRDELGNVAFRQHMLRLIFHFCLFLASKSFSSALLSGLAASLFDKK